MKAPYTLLIGVGVVIGLMATPVRAQTLIEEWGTAKFPAPPDSVQKIGVVVPHFIPMDDVPISR